MGHLSQEGHALAESLHCPCLNVSRASVSFDDAMVEEALRALIESIAHRTGLLNIYKGAPSNPGSEPDIRIIMCLLCGDPYSVENVLGPLLKQQNCYLSGERSVALEVPLGETKRKVEVILSSYHSATDFREELIHGFILVYSTKRRASLATLSTFSMNIPELPIQVLAVTEQSSSQPQYQTFPPGVSQAEIEARLISEGGHLADRLNAHFMTSTTALQQKSSFYTPFFKEVHEKKSEIEHAFSMEDNGASRLDDSGEGTLERPPLRRQPMPPPRMDSYRLQQQQQQQQQPRHLHPHLQQPQPHRGGPPSNPSRSGSGSEIYERLPADEESRSIHSSDDSDVYDSMDRQKNGRGEHLVKPSQIKSKKRQQGN